MEVGLSLSLSLSLLELCKELQLVWLARPDFLHAYSEHYIIQWNLSIEDTTGTQLAVLYTVEPLYRGHHWDPAGCPVYSGTSL